MNQLRCQQQITMANCPIHASCPLKRLQSKKTGHVFFSCPEMSCPLLCFKHKVGSYLNAVNTKLLPISRNYTLRCQCQKSTTLKVSNSNKNPKRPYFTCREYEEACKFFQWGEEELTDANFQLAVGQEEKR